MFYVVVVVVEYWEVQVVVDLWIDLLVFLFYVQVFMVSGIVFVFIVVMEQVVFVVVLQFVIGCGEQQVVVDVFVVVQLYVVDYCCVQCFCLFVYLGYGWVVYVFGLGDGFVGEIIGEGFWQDYQVGGVSQWCEQCVVVGVVVGWIVLVGVVLDEGNVQVIY